MAKLSGWSDTNLTAAAQQLADFIFDGNLVLDIVVLDADPVVEDLRMNLVKGERRKMGGVIFGFLPPPKTCFCGAKTPTTVNKSPSIWTSLPTAGSLPKSSSAVSEPRTTTLALRCAS